MLTLVTVGAQSGAQAPQQCTFSGVGGSIGRGKHNDLVLIDPDKRVSREHARVVFRSDGPRLVCVSPASFQHNGQAIEQGEEVRLAHGDRIELGGFSFQVAGVDGIP